MKFHRRLRHRRRCQHRPGSLRSGRL